MSLDDPIVIGTAEVSEVEAVLEPALAPAPVAASLPSRFACFVTGTDTEIGKTLTSSALLSSPMWALLRLLKSGPRARCG